MRQVAIVAAAWEVGSSDGRSDGELLAAVTQQALAASRLGRDEIDVVCTAGSEFLDGVVGSMMGAFDAFCGWPPRAHTHQEGDGAFALYEAWIRLLAGEADAAMVCAWGRPLAADGAEPLTLQLDPYVIAPLGVDVHQLAALQARALLDGGHCTPSDLIDVARARRPGLDAADAAAQPFVSSPLRASDCPDIASGAATVVLAAEPLVRAERPAWIAGIDQRIETAAFGARDLTRSPSTRAAAERLAIVGEHLDLVELHARYSHHVPILLDALGAGSIDRIDASGGVLAADPLMVAGLIRIGEAASAVQRGEARRAVAHATNGPLLQQNLLCDLRGVK